MTVRFDAFRNPAQNSAIAIRKNDDRRAGAANFSKYLKLFAGILKYGKMLNMILRELALRRLAHIGGTLFYKTFLFPG